MAKQTPPPSDLAAKAKTFIDGLPDGRCRLCQWTDGKAAIDAIIDEMIASRRKVAVSRIALFIEEVTGHAPDWKAVDRHLRRHEKRWPDVQALAVPSK